MSVGPDEFLNSNIGSSYGDALAGDLSEDLRARIKGELEPGERLLWASQSSPPPKRVSPGYYFWSVIILGLFWTGASLIWDDVRPHGGGGIDGRWFGGVLLLGLGAVIGYSVLMVWRAQQAERFHKSNVLFAITNQRAIVWVPKKHRREIRIMSVYRREIKELSRVERPDGSGTLEFSWPQRHYGDWRPTGFENVPDVRRVEAIFRNNLMKRDAAE